MTSPRNTNQPRRAVILAAGKGSRLSNGDGGPPKPLVRLHGRPLIDYTLQALSAAGIGEALVVTGYREGEVRAGIAELNLDGVRLSLVSNPAFDSPASTSLRAARDWCGDAPFLLAMSDHVFSADLLTRFLAAAPPGESSVAADFSARDDAYVDEATLLELDGDSCVVAIGKGLSRWQAIDAGAFIVQPEAWETILATPERCELSVVFGEVARALGLAAVDIADEFWYDIDTAADLAAAEKLLEGY